MYKNELFNSSQIFYRISTDCVHFAVAVKKLPEQKLHNGYVPKCDENGKFAPIQCDQRQCWCVDVNYGSEIPGSSVAISMRRADMCRGDFSLFRVGLK
ncbi:thyroglobulin type-1 repeat-containing domain protein [Ancylostoma caninum]|uniref:Thyroglobulin type-1 repeat-containing domain protein n=1 Tax=Ancylostoma caninum TaxID=29170 RepID=A0A368EYM0_ANCCA|nr:thyroglobulin type-1 repeat-containing domain protein [Ancylostoma caninum]